MWLGARTSRLLFPLRQAHFSTAKSGKRRPVKVLVRASGGGFAPVLFLPLFRQNHIIHLLHHTTHCALLSLLITDRAHCGVVLISRQADAFEQPSWGISRLWKRASNMLPLCHA